MKRKFRFHRGGLAESMSTMIEVKTKKELLKKINEAYSFGPVVKDVEITRYADPDRRIDWEGCYIVCLPDNAGVVGWMDGEFA